MPGESQTSSQRSLTQRQQLSGAVPSSVGVLRFTLEAMAAYEAAKPSGSVARLLALAWVMLLHARPGLDREELGASLDADDLTALSRDVTLCLRLSTSDAKAPAKQQTEPTDWMRLWSYAEIDLRIPEERFWLLTPRQFQALSDRHEEAVIRSLHGAAMITATLANIHRDKKKHPEAYMPADFLPTLGNRTEKLKAARDLRETSRSIFAGMGERTVKVTPRKLELLKRG